MVRGIQDLVNRNREGRGVQVYSPIRPLTRPGSFANAGTARQILGQSTGPEMTPRSQGTQVPRIRVPGVRGSLPGYEVPSEAGSEPLPVPGVGGSYLDRLLAARPAQASSPEPAQGGFLGTVVNSLPGRAVMGALNVLDVPRRAVISTIQETADAFNGGDVSFDDWARQVSDPTFGFGDVVGSTGNIWGDRLIGFAGDVLLDPLTYVGGSSAISGTGRAARLGGATRAIRSGVDTEVAERLGRFGYSAVNKTERAMLREAANDTILDPGFYFKFPLTPRVRIPGTGGVETAVAGAFGRRRAQFAGSTLGRAMRAISTPDLLGPAYTKVLTGEGDMPFEWATEFIRFRKAFDTAGPAATAQLNALSRQFLSENGPEGLNEAMRQAQRDGTGPFAEWTRAAVEIQEAFGMRLPMGPRQFYAPYILTDGGKEWVQTGKLANATDPMAADFANVFFKDVDLDATPVHLQSRTLFVPRDEPYIINGKQLKIDRGDGIDEINAKFAALVPEAKFKLLDDNATTVMARYSKSMEDSIGTIAGLKALQNSKAGLVRAGDDESVLELVENMAKTELLNDEEIKRLNMYKRSSADSLKVIREDTLNGISGIQGVLGSRVRGTIETLTEVEPKVRARLLTLLQQEQSLTRQRGGRSMSGAFGRTSFDGAPGPPVTGALEKEFDRTIAQLEKRATKVEGRLAALKQRAIAEDAEWQRIKAAALENGQVARIPAHLRALREWQRTYEEAARLAMDRESLQVLRARVIANDVRSQVAAARAADDTFLYAAADRGAAPDPRTGRGYEPIRNVRERRVLIPGGPEVDAEGNLTGRRVPETLWRNRREEDIAAELNIDGAVNRSRALHEAEREAVITEGIPVVDQAMMERAALIQTQLENVTHWESEVARIAKRDGGAIMRARQELERQQRNVQQVQAMIYMAEGHVDRSGFDRQGELIEYLNELRSPTGALGQAQARLQDAQINVVQAQKRLSLENKTLQSLREEQIADGLRLGSAVTPNSPPPTIAALPLTDAEERALRSRLRQAEARRDKWLATPEGQAAKAVDTELADIQRQLDPSVNGSVANRIERSTGERGGLRPSWEPTPMWRVDRRGNLQPLSNQAVRNEKVLTVLRERDDLIRQLDEALAAGDNTAADRLQGQLNRKNSRLAKLKFDTEAYATYVAQRADLEDELRLADAQLADARSAMEGRAADNATQRARAEVLAAAERNHARVLKRMAANEDRAFSYARSKTELSQLISERNALKDREKALVRSQRKYRARQARLDKRIEELSGPLRSQDSVRERNAQRASAQRIGQPRYRAAEELPAPVQTREQTIRSRLAEIDAREKATVERIRQSAEPTIAERLRLDMELVPPLPDPPHHPFAINERLLLREAYAKIGQLRAGVTTQGGDLGVDGARKLVREIEDLLYPVSPREAAVAADSLAEIERAWAMIEASRSPFPYPAEGTKLHKVLMGGLTTEQRRGGAMDLTSRAKAAKAAATNILDTHQDQLVTSGALIPGDFRALREMRDELDKQLKFYAHSPHPNVKSRIDQLTADVGRAADFMWTYKRALDTGEVQASDQLGAFILNRVLYREGRVLDSKIKQYQGLLADDVQRWAAIEQNRRLLEHELAYEELTTELGELENARLGIPVAGSPHQTYDPRTYKQVYERSRAHARAIEEIQAEGTPILGILDEDLDALFEVVQGMIIDIDDATSMLRDRRDLVKDFDRPFRKREQLEAQIPMLHGQIDEMRANTDALREARAQAISRGDTTVTWNPWSTNANPIDWTIEEAEALIPQAPKHMRPELRRKLKMAKDRRARAMSVTSRQSSNTQQRVKMAQAGVSPEPITLTIDEATQRLASNDKVLQGLGDSMRLWTLQLSVLDGTATERLTVAKQLLRDDLQPPDVRAQQAARLQAENEQILTNARNRVDLPGAQRQTMGPHRTMRPEEEAKYQFNLKRIEVFTTEGGLTPEAWSRYTDESELLTTMIAQYKQLHADEEDYIAAVVDHGNNWFDQLINGDRDPEPEDAELLIELLGGETGQYADTWVRRLKEIIPGPGYGREGRPGASGVRARDVRMSLNELNEIVREIAFTFGDTSIGQRMAQRAADLVTETGEVGEEVLAGMRNELYMNLVNTANRERTARITDMGHMLNDLGFEFFIPSASAAPTPGVPAGAVRAEFTLNQKMSALGYSQSKQRFSPTKLRLYLLERFEQMGYDLNRSIETQLRDLEMRAMRMDTMRRGLGGQVNLTHAQDPEMLHRRMARGRALNELDEFGAMETDADVYRRLGVPEDVETVFNQRMVALQTELSDAIARNDRDAVNEAMDLIEQLNAGRAVPRETGAVAPEPMELPPPPPEAAAAEMPAPEAAPAEMPPPVPGSMADPHIEQQRMDLIRQRDEASARQRRTKDELDALRPAAVAGPSGPVSADPHAELQALAEAASPPAGAYTRAQYEAVKAEMQRLGAVGVASRTPEQQEVLMRLQALLGKMRSNLWRQEPQADRNLAAELARQYEEILEGPADVPTADPAALAALQEEYDNLGRQVEDLERQINELPADPIAVPGPPDGPPPTPAAAALIGEQPSMLEDAPQAILNEGGALPDAAPDEIPSVTRDPTLRDDELTHDDLRYEHRMSVREFEQLSRDYGGYDNAPPGVQREMSELAARIRKLNDLQEAQARQAIRGDVDLERYNRLREPEPRQITFDWRNVLFHGTPSQAVINTQMQGSMADAARRISGARVGLSAGRMHAGSLPSQQARLVAQKGPMETLRQQLLATSAEAAAASTADRAAIGTLEEGIEAGEAAIQATRDRLTAEALAPPPEYAAAVAGERQGNAAMAGEMSAAQREQQAIQMARLRAEQQYSQRLIDLDMQLGSVREEVTRLSNEVGAIERQRADFARVLETTPTTENARLLLNDLREINEWRRGRPEEAGPTADLSALNAARAKAGKPPVAIAPVSDVDQVEVLLQEAMRSLQRLEVAGFNDNLAARRLKEFASGARKVGPVMEKVVIDAFKPIAREMLNGPDAVVIATDLAKVIQNVSRAAAEPRTWKLIDKFTAFFKTYATATPGFHVRNAISGVFMNLVDNVRLREMGAAPGLWRAFMTDSRGFMETTGGQVLNERTGATMRDAFNIVFGSGAGGQFAEYGVGTASTTSSRAYQHIMNNALTRWNRTTGTYVEGPLRLAMAVDSLRKGMDPEAALDRVIKFHFNYNQASKFDRTAKRYIPFWTFMSRNFPLQIEQMWLRPQMYLKYQSFVRNFAEAGNPYTPEYWLAQGAFTMDPNADEPGATPWYLAPDLPHLRIAEPFEAISQGNIGKAALSDINPLFLAPAEAFAFNRKAYTGAPVEENYREPTLAMKGLMPLFRLLGGTEVAGSGERVLDDRYAHLARSLWPTLNLAERLTDETGTREGRQDETIYRALGLPVYQLNPALKNTTRRGRYYDRRDERQTQAELARL